MSTLRTFMDFDVFDADSSVPAPPVWLAMASERAQEVRRASATGLLALLPVEAMIIILSFASSDALAAVSACAVWLDALMATAAPAAVKRLGLCQLPVRRLSEGWACVVRRAELRCASRQVARLSVGVDTVAWIDENGVPRLACRASQQAEGQMLRGRGCGCEVPVYVLPRLSLPHRRARSVACGSFHALVLCEDASLWCTRQLGRSEDPVPPAWTLLRPAPKPGEEATAFVACGAFHCLAVGEHVSGLSIHSLPFTAYHAPHAFHCLAVREHASGLSIHRMSFTAYHAPARTCTRQPPLPRGR